MLFLGQRLLRAWCMCTVGRRQCRPVFARKEGLIPNETISSHRKQIISLEKSPMDNIKKASLLNVSNYLAHLELRNRSIRTVVDGRKSFDWNSTSCIVWNWFLRLHLDCVTKKVSEKMGTVCIWRNHTVRVTNWTKFEVINHEIVQ